MTMHVKLSNFSNRTERGVRPPTTTRSWLETNRSGALCIELQAMAAYLSTIRPVNRQKHINMKQWVRKRHHKHLREAPIIQACSGSVTTSLRVWENVLPIIDSKLWTLSNGHTSSHIKSHLNYGEQRRPIVEFAQITAQNHAHLLRHMPNTFSSMVCRRSPCSSLRSQDAQLIRSYGSKCQNDRCSMSI